MASRFANLRKYLQLKDAWIIYRRLKSGNLDNMRIAKLKHPFSLRNNPFDYATFEEVLLRETYNVPINFQPKNIIDGGGNIGLTAVYFANRFPDATIITLEPDKENFSVLQKNVQYYKNIKPLNKGVWNKSTHLVVKDLGLGNNAFIVEEVSDGTVAAIESAGIYQLMRENGWAYIDILKLDVEGSEKNIFSENYKEWLPKTRVLIVELHDRMQQGCSKAVFSAIAQYNFSCEIAGENLLFMNQELQIP